MSSDKDTFGDGMGAAITIVVVMSVTYFVGSCSNDAEWKTDCRKVGAHRSDSSVFTCKPQPEEDKK